MEHGARSTQQASEQSFMLLTAGRQLPFLLHLLGYAFQLISFTFIWEDHGLDSASFSIFFLLLSIFFIVKMHSVQWFRCIHTAVEPVSVAFPFGITETMHLSYHSSLESLALIILLSVP